MWWHNINMLITVWLSLVIPSSELMVKLGRESEDECDPFSFLGCLKYHLDDNSWGDEIIVAVGRIWHLTITIIIAGPFN